MKQWWGGSFILLLAAGLFAVAVIAKSDTAQLAQVIAPETETVSTKPISLVLVGDIMLDRGVRRSVNFNFDGSYDELFAHTSYLQDADIAFGNLEGPAATSGHNVGSKYSFRMDPSVPSVLSRAGFDVVSFANNHVGDYTKEAFDETRTHLTENNILYAGAGENYADVGTPRIIEVRGMKIGFLGASDVGPEWIKATDTSSGILLANDPNLSTIVSNAKKQVDILVVSFHWGEEYKESNTRQETLAHQMIDAGADIIVGAHPHVAQRVETYQGKPIFYSLGNFIFDQAFSKETMQGMVAKVFIDDQKNIHYQTDTVHLDTRFQPQTLVVAMLDDMVVAPEGIAVNDCPKPIQDTGVDLKLLSIPTPYSLIGYIPGDLVPVGTRETGESWCLKKDAASALAQMNAAMKSQGLGLTVTTGYRAEADQNEMKTSFDARGMTAFVADVGASEHQLGTAADFAARSGGSFASSAEYAWLRAHGAVYGFVQSYTAQFEKQNGFPAEPWHWRYVGKDIAQKILSSGMSVNMYLKKITVE